MDSVTESSSLSAPSQDTALNGITILNRDNPDESYWFPIDAVQTWEKLLEAVSTRFKTGNGGLGFQIYVGEMKIHPFEWQLCLVAGETYDVVFSGKDGGSADSTTAFV